jgi:hypothetical protein
VLMCKIALGIRRNVNPPVGRMSSEMPYMAASSRSQMRFGKL